MHGYSYKAVVDYTDWKISKVIGDISKNGFRRAGAIALQNGLDLDFLLKKGKNVFDDHEGLGEQ